VQLKGVVDNDAQLRAAEAIARNISGVRSVQNDLRVAALSAASRRPLPRPAAIHSVAIAAGDSRRGAP
jgi:hypothetical protein